MNADPHKVAARLGVDAETIRRLDARDHLPRLALSEARIRARLYQAHLAHLHRHSPGQTRKERS